MNKKIKKKLKSKEIQKNRKNQKNSICIVNISLPSF